MNIRKYREKRRKIIHVDGFEFKIRPLSVMAMTEILSKIGSFRKLQEHPEEHLDVLIPIVLTRCVVSPRIVLREVKEDEEVLSIDEIDPQTASRIIEEVFKISGLSEAELEKIEKFRGDTNRNTSSQSITNAWNSTNSSTNI